jgi:uncharacterized membrane protein
VGLKSSRLHHSLGRWDQLLAHRHWITLHAFGKELRLCARCSGVVFGFLSARTVLWGLTFVLSYVIPFSVGFAASLLLALPAILDWVTQAMGFRESYNRLRMTTGFLEGAGVGLLSLAEAPALLRFLVVFIINVGVLGLGRLGRRFRTQPVP